MTNKSDVTKAKTGREIRNFIVLITLFFILLFSIISFKTKSDAIIIIRGSETIFPLCETVSESFVKTKKEYSFDIKAEGTEIGLSSLKRKQIHIAMASRPLNLGEKIYLQESNLKYTEKIIAYDALAMVVNPHNPVSNLTKAQIKGIYEGRITNWKELGGENHDIIVYSRDPNSGTYSFFNELFLENTRPAKQVIPVADNTEIINRIQQNKYAICYIGLGYLNDDVKGLSISIDGSVFISPSEMNVQNQIYPIIRPLYFYYLNKDNDLVEPFVNYVLSEEGQEIILKSNYISIKNHSNPIRNIMPIL